MIYEGSNFKTHNPRIQNMLCMILWRECRVWFSDHNISMEEAPWGKPELKNKVEVDEVELVLPIHCNGNRDASDTINDTLNDTLNDSVMTTYTIIRLNPGIQRKGISDMSGKSVATTSRHLAILLKEGLIEHRDSDKTGGYYAK